MSPLAGNETGCGVVGWMHFDWRDYNLHMCHFTSLLSRHSTSWLPGPSSETGLRDPWTVTEHNMRYIPTTVRGRGMDSLDFVWWGVVCSCTHQLSVLVAMMNVLNTNWCVLLCYMDTWPVLLLVLQIVKRDQKSFVINISKEYSIVSQFTSFVAIEEREKVREISPQFTKSKIVCFPICQFCGCEGERECKRN